MNSKLILALPFTLTLTACLTTTQQKSPDLDKLSCKELRELRQDMEESKERVDGGTNILGSLVATIAPASGGELIGVLGKAQDIGGLTLYQVENAMKLAGCKG